VASHEEADKIIQSMSIWSMLDWQVIPLQGIDGRLEQEKAMLAQMAD